MCIQKEQEKNDNKSRRAKHTRKARIDFFLNIKFYKKKNQRQILYFLFFLSRFSYHFKYIYTKMGFLLREVTYKLCEPNIYIENIIFYVHQRIKFKSEKNGFSLFSFFLSRNQRRYILW